MGKISGIIIAAVFVFVISVIGCSKAAPAQPAPENTATATDTAAFTATETHTPTDTPQDTATETATETETATDTHTITETPTDANTPTETFTSTPTRTPNPCAIIGGDDPDNGNVSSSSDLLCAQPFTAGSDGIVDSLGVFLNYLTVYCAGLYSDDSGNPGILLASTGVHTAASTGWNINAVTSAAVTSGAQYWIVAIGKTAGPLLRQGTASGFKYKTYSFIDVENTGLPQDSSGWILDTYNMSLKGYVADCP